MSVLEPYGPSSVRKRAIHYGLAVLYPALGTVLGLTVFPLLNDRISFLQYFPAVLLAAYSGGFGPGIVATAVSLLASLYFFITPEQMFVIDDPRWYPRMVIFAIVCLAISAVCGRLREALLQAEANALTAREQADQAERASRLKDEFLATISHELRTPLNALLGWSRILRGGRRDEALVGRGLEVIERNTLALNRLIEDLLDVSRIVSGKLLLDVRTVDVARTVEAAVESIRLAAEAKGVALDVAVDPSVGRATGDLERLQQVVWNLLSNAVKFTPKGGRVTVRAERADSRIRLTVSDTGQGIAPEFLPYVFDRFRQADSSTKRHFGGLGLGLSIVRHLVELHGGTVRAESDGVDRGAAFVVELPAAAVVTTDSDQVDRAPAAPSELAGLRALVVDDEADARDLVSFILERHGAEVVTAGSADEAATRAEERWPDVVITDIGMPGRDGYDLLAELDRMCPAGRRLQSVALTAYAHADDVERAKEAGFDAHLTKPAEPQDLVATVARVAGRT